MQSTRRLLECVLTAYHEADWDECIRTVRTLVDASPQADASRQLLASLYVRMGNSRMALLQYRKLLPAAIERGGLFRAVAFQRLIDELSPAGSLASDRWEDLQARLRRGEGVPDTVPIGSARPWSEAALIALPAASFRRIGEETRVELIGLDPWSAEVETGTIWEILSGRLRWGFALPDGRASAERLAAEGEAIRIEPELGQRAYVSMMPELPVEWLCFGASLARDLERELVSMRGRSRPATSAKAVSAGALDEPATDRVTPTPVTTNSVSLTTPNPATPDLTDSMATDPVTPVTPVTPATPDPFAAPIPDGAQGRDRRRHPRVGASFESRLAMLRLPGSLVSPIRGQLVDLSTSGLSARFRSQDLGAARATLEDAVVALELDVPGPQGPLRVAAQVRWIEIDEAAGETRIGIEFVLLTEPDRRLIAGTLARVSLASGFLRAETR